MVEKKVTKTATAKKNVAKKAVDNSAKSSVLALNAENAGFKAGDVYQTLAAAEAALSVAEIAKKAKISEEETILGIGWLFKEGKIKEVCNKVTLA
nr:winged helix-turn-helix domain-containing protein [Prevotella sp.]